MDFRNNYVKTLILPLHTSSSLKPSNESILGCFPKITSLPKTSFFPQERKQHQPKNPNTHKKPNTKNSNTQMTQNQRRKNHTQKEVIMELGLFLTSSAGIKNYFEAYKRHNYLSKHSLYHKQRGITKLSQAKTSIFA